ncbi:cell envelope integrity protein TolA [Candidatus Williamhamiltonella defendens]|uniref:cell envelope integrity protein TolA n=1 Tax=Candidatus Williamhamiltonella defendens TaxID=138072 RepID=UPI00130ED3E1|nr:cell envelope integrity protein TolA [Candidatus Hamiltonella defensa]
MEKFTKENKLNYALILSGFLHLIFIIFMIINSSRFKLNKGSQGDQGDKDNVIDAIIVDRSRMTEQYQPHQNQEAKPKLVLERQTKEAQQQAEKHNEEQQRLKISEEERLQAQENKKQEIIKRKRQIEEQHQRLVDQQKQINSAIKKAQEEQKQVKLAADNAKIEAKRIRSEIEKKVQAEQKRKKSVAVAKKKSENTIKNVAQLFDDLASPQNTPNIQITERGKKGSHTEIKSYLDQIIHAIQSKFYDASLYNGKRCHLRIKLAPDGKLISIREESGDTDLCQSAVAAAKQAHIPKPPNKDVYQVFKNASLVFTP